MTTTRALIEETKRHLYSGYREKRNRLDGLVTDADLQIKVKYGMAGIKEGAELAVDLELFYVWEVNDSAKTAVVERGVLGSAPAEHDDAATVTVNPRFSDFAIFQALNDELGALSGEGLFRLKGIDVPYSASVRGYDLAGATGFIAPYEVRWKLTGPSKEWPLIGDYEIAGGMATSEFASGSALLLEEGGQPGRPVRFTFKAGFDPLGADLDADVAATTGLHAEAHDILPIGAAARLVAPTEVKRNFTEAQGETRRASEVPPGARLQSGNGLLALRRDRVRAEVARLHRLYPIRRR